MNRFLDKGKELPNFAQTFAIGSYSPFLDKYSIIGQIDPEKWDFVVTVAGIFIAITQLNHENISKQDKDNVLDEVTKAAIKIYPHYINACEDCRNFVDRTYDGLVSKKEYQNNQRLLFSDSLGSWVVWNIFGHAPDDEKEIELIRIIGAFLVHPFITWWQ